ncbi:MAG: hypothetical protein J5787_00980 [Alphaproteobacteria bacterium]|nr:hypothetical protein [Alphaproteobacteria bacterium]
MEKTAQQKTAQDTKDVSEKKGVSKEKAKEIKVSKQVASKIRRRWEALAKRQENGGIRVRANRKITSVSFVKDENGKVSVQVNLRNGRSIKDNAEEKGLEKFQKESRRAYARTKIAELLKKIKELGFAAVEGEIPPELKDAVLKSMARANISTSHKGTKAQEAEAKKSGSSSNTKTDTLKSSGSLFNTSPVFATTGYKPVDTLLRSAQESFKDPIYESRGIKQVSPVTARYPGGKSCSTEETISIKLPDGSTIDLTLVGQDTRQNRIKADCLAKILWKAEHNESLTEEEKKLIEEAEKKGIHSLEDLKKKPALLNNISYKKFPKNAQEALEATHKEDMDSQKRFINERAKDKNKLPPVSLDIKPGKDIDHLTKEGRGNRKNYVEDPDDKLLMQYLNAVTRLHGTKTVTDKELEMAQRMKEEHVNLGALWKIVNDKKLTSEQKLEATKALEEETKKNSNPTNDNGGKSVDPKPKSLQHSIEAEGDPKAAPKPKSLQQSLEAEGDPKAPASNPADHKKEQKEIRKAVNAIKMEEALHLFTKLKNKEELTPDEEKRVKEWNAKGVMSLKDFSPNGKEKAKVRQVVDQISDKGITKAYEEKLNQAKKGNQKGSLNRALLTTMENSEKQKAALKGKARER